MRAATSLAPIAACLALIGCGARGTPMTRAQLATVERAATSCTAASSALVPPLRNGDRAGAENAAIAARNACSSARATILATVGAGGVLDACTRSVDRQEAAQQAELRVFDAPTPGNQRQVVATLDDAIREQTACAAATAEQRGG